jgi:hypothetical protein
LPSSRTVVIGQPKPRPPHALASVGLVHEVTKTRPSRAERKRSEERDFNDVLNWGRFDSRGGRSKVSPCSTPEEIAALHAVAVEAGGRLARLEVPRGGDGADDRRPLLRRRRQREETALIAAPPTEATTGCDHTVAPRECLASSTPVVTSEPQSLTPARTYGLPAPDSGEAGLGAVGIASAAAV